MFFLVKNRDERIVPSHGEVDALVRRGWRKTTQHEFMKRRIRRSSRTTEAETTCDVIL